jgi:anti-sigma-K factor RskA
MDEQHVDEQIDAYALGALEPEELASVESHLEYCARCQQLAAAARAASRVLLYGAPLVEPPSDLRARVLQRIHQVATADAAHAEANTHPRPGLAPEDSGDAETLSAGLAAGGGQGWGRLGRLVRSILGEEPAGGDPAADLLAVMLANPTCAIWNVGGTDDAPGASARLVGVPTGRDAVLVTSGLRRLPPDRAYQVWFLRGGQPVPNALFRVAGGGRGRQVVRAPTRLDEFEVVAVTPEPASGSPAPTGPIVLMGQLSA